MMIRKRYILALGVVLLLLGHLYYYQTGDFRPSYLLEAEEGVGNELPTSFFNQPYTYLGHGNQSFAFVSEDGRYVLKLFKKDYFQRTFLIHVFPPVFLFRNFFLYSGKGKASRRDKLLKGYQTAYDYDREDSGLLFYHPAASEGQNLKVTLVTGLGNSLTLNLNDYVFALQVKVIPTKKELSRLLSEGNTTEAKERIQQLFALYVSGYRRGIFDHDHNLFDNTGFYEDRAIRQDVGKVVRDFSLTDEENVRKDLKKIAWERLAPWVYKNFPQYAEEIVLSIDSEERSSLQSLKDLRTKL